MCVSVLTLNSTHFLSYSYSLLHFFLNSHSYSSFSFASSFSSPFSFTFSLSSYLVLLHLFPFIFTPISHSLLSFFRFVFTSSPSHSYLLSLFLSHSHLLFFFSSHSDVVFFDESIDAKLNRYMFKFRNIDTPFLLDNANLHAKTYVPPTANTVGLTDYGKDGRIYEYARFPSLE